jgi:hypothetical protein
MNHSTIGTLRLAFLVAVLLLLLAPAAHAAERSLTTKDGRLAMPMPRAAGLVAIKKARGGGATLRFGVSYVVSHTKTVRGRVARDRAEIRIKVARELFPTGPNPDKLVYEKTILDKTGLRTRLATRKYAVRLPRAAYAFLVSQGISSPKETLRNRARRLVNIHVFQYRDYKRVDGKYDWIEGTTFSAVTLPLRALDNPGGAVTVTNDTGKGVWDWGSNTFYVEQLYGPQGDYPYLNLLSQQPGSTNVPGTFVAMSGQAISCLYQGTDSSNPNGFDIGLGQNTSVSQTIVADDSTFDRPNTDTEAASASDAALWTMKAEVTGASIAAGIAFGGPFLLPISLITNFLLFGGGNCSSQPNVFLLAAVTGDGEGAASYNWAIWDGCNGTCGGLATVYTAPWQSSAPDVDAAPASNSVQLAPDSQKTFNGQALWLGQVWTGGCGVGDASDSNTSGCTSQNTISLRWFARPPCPWYYGMYVNGGLQGGAAFCWQSPPTSPQVDYCGTNNAGCVSYADSNTARRH